MMQQQDPYIVNSLEDLNDIYAPPAPEILAGIKTSLHDFHVEWFREATFICLGSSDGERFDVSPRGGEKGFVHVIDRNTIAIPDWRGNNKIETIRNIVSTGRIALLFLYPGLSFFFRANGSAEVTRNPDLLEAMAHNGKQPFTAIRINIARVYLHCGKAAMRSKLWRAESQAYAKELPSLAKMVKEFTRIEATEEAIREDNETMLRERLY